MAKTLSAGVETEIGNTHYIAAELVEFELSTPLYLTTAQFDVETSTGTSGGTQTYIAQGSFLGFSALGETSDLRINNITISFSAATNTYVNIALNDNYLHRVIRIYKVWFNTADLSVIANPLLLYEGTITGVNVVDTSSETTVNFDTSNQFYDFERTNGRKTNEGSQRRQFPADRGMQYSTSDVADINWGRV